jgi:predicted RND superfamily exporter protein
VDSEGKITGQGVLGQVINQRIVGHFQWSFLVALAAVFLVLMVALRSLRLATVSLVSNVFTPLMVAGLMGFFGIDLRYTSALVLSVVFGLAVDDTIHFISQFGRGDDPVRHAFTTAGPGILLTSLVLGAGFAVLMLSDYQPTRVLGLLLGVTAVTAVIADLVLLPALLRLSHPGPVTAEPTDLS